LKEYLILAGYWLLIMALIGGALLVTKKLAELINRGRRKTEEKRDTAPGGEFRNPYFVSEEEIEGYKRQTEEYNTSKEEQKKDV
jgi:hypothetical protein